MNRFPILLFAGLVLFLLTSCSSDLVQPVQIRVPSGFGGIMNIGDTLTVSAGGLASGEFPIIIQALTKTGDVAAEASLSADVDGNIGSFILAYDLGQWDTPGDGRLSPGQYTIKLTSIKGTAESDITVPNQPNHSAIYACDSDGKVTGGFETGTPVFVAARKMIVGKKYRIWPIADRRSWADGDLFKSWQMTQPGVSWPDGIPAYIEVESNANGDLPVTQLLPYATKMVANLTDQFDIILDAAPYGVFNASTDAVDGQLPTGVVVQDKNDGAPFLAELACRKDYVYTNVFTSGEPVYIWLNPGIQNLSPHARVCKYIVKHIAEWIDGMALKDVTAGAESDGVEHGCANEGLVLVWPSSTPGDYDAVIDMNANGIYDEGTDILDGGPSGPGFRVIG